MEGSSGSFNSKLLDFAVQYGMDTETWQAMQNAADQRRQRMHIYGAPIAGDMPPGPGYLTPIRPEDLDQFLEDMEAIGIPNFRKRIIRMRYREVDSLSGILFTEAALELAPDPQYVIINPVFFLVHPLVEHDPLPHAIWDLDPLRLKDLHTAAEWEQLLAEAADSSAMLAVLSGPRSSLPSLTGLEFRELGNVYYRTFGLWHELYHTLIYELDRVQNWQARFDALFKANPGRITFKAGLKARSGMIRYRTEKDVQPGAATQLLVRLLEFTETFNDKAALYILRALVSKKTASPAAQRFIDLFGDELSKDESEEFERFWDVLIKRDKTGTIAIFDRKFLFNKSLLYKASAIRAALEIIKS